MEVLVTGNCQAAAVTPLLRLLLPRAQFRYVPSEALFAAEEREQLHRIAEGADVWLQQLPHGQGGLDDVRCRVITFPTVQFPAFHPDVVHAFTNDGRSFVGLSPYHSAIVLWAWRRGLGASETVALLEDDSVHRSLGYFDFWAPSVEALKEAFDESSVPFVSYWSRAHRLGRFMHTVNHPRHDASALMAKCLIEAADLAEVPWNDPVQEAIDDPLAYISLPIYPSIGEQLGMAGVWRWRIHDRVYDGTREFVHATLAAYAQCDPAEVRCARIDSGAYAEVLENCSE